jgi:hypothetical protein
MTPVPEDIAERQADITRLLLHHIHTPLPGDQRIRGILPPPPSAESIRVVTGDEKDDGAEELTAWEFPLRTSPGSRDLIGGEQVLGVLRALLVGTHIYPGSRIATVMGMTLIRVDHSELGPVAPDRYEGVHTILRTLACPWTEEQEALRLRGFLLFSPDRLRLYVDREGDTDVVAADVRTSGPLTALLAALPSLIAEEERAGRDDADPHCTRLTDLTEWR